ncbi:unnamed protein product [Urochloa humidicola]
MVRANTDDSPWSSSLPPKIAAAVLRLLPSHVDRVRFAAVCRPWRAAAASQPRQPLPWLTLPDGTFFSFPGSTAVRFPAAAGYHGSAMTSFSSTAPAAMGTCSRIRSPGTPCGSRACPASASSSGATAQRSRGGASRTIGEPPGARPCES